MFIVIGCLGSIVGEVASTDEAMQIVLKQLPVGKKKVQAMCNALQRLRAGSEYQLEYGTSGCTVRCV